MKAFNIQWDVDLDDFLEALNQMPHADAAKAIGVSQTIYRIMPKAQIRDYARQKFDTNKTDVAGFLGLPSEVEIPETIEHDEETISEWLSDTYKFCHTGFELTTVLAEYEVYATKMRDAQICKKEDDTDDDWMDYANDPLLDIIYAANEDDAVQQIADSMEIEKDVLCALQHIVSVDVPIEHDGKATSKRFEAVSFKEDKKAGIEISFDNEKIMSVYIQDNKLRYCTY